MTLVAEVSAPIIAGLLGLAGIIVTTAGGVITALLTRESRAQNKKAKAVVSDFEEAWEDRGKLIDGMGQDMDVLRSRLKVVEDREKNCLEALEFAHSRIAVLESKLGVTPPKSPQVRGRRARS